MQQLLFIDIFNKYEIFHKQRSNIYLLLFQILIYNIYFHSLILLYSQFPFTQKILRPFGLYHDFRYRKFQHTSPHAIYRKTKLS